MKRIHDYIHYYRGYWSDGGRCRIRIYQEDGHVPMVICLGSRGGKNTGEGSGQEFGPQCNPKMH